MTMLVSGNVNSGNMHTIPDRVRKLEELGWNSVSIGETQHQPFLPLMLVAEHTKEMEFGPSVAIAFPRAPHISANLAWDLQKYSGGRFSLGLGTQVKGHNERRFSVPWAPPGPHLRDYIQCMRAIWDSWQNGTKPDYEGEYYQYKLTSPFFNPGPIEHPDIKVIISAVNPFNARLAGEVCDGIAIHGFSTFKYIQDVPARTPLTSRSVAAACSPPGATKKKSPPHAKSSAGESPSTAPPAPTPTSSSSTAGTTKPPISTDSPSMVNGTK
jgi:probable F420-dependent oxidoreductase